MTVTIYSQHPSRGKVQILATFSTEAGLRSSTVTSVEASELAEPIIDALNRISACLTVPECVWDSRRHSSYPSDHLAAAADRSRRHELLTGAQSLWYEYVKMVLHEALEDLDKAYTAVPDPVRTAIEAELTTEVSQLQVAFEYLDHSEVDVETHRLWDSDLPTVLFNGGLHELRTDAREEINRGEERLFDRTIEQAVDDLRFLFEAHARCSEPSARLDAADRSIDVEPFDQSEEHGFYLSVDAPTTFTSGRRGWQVSVNKWVPEPDYSEEEGGTAIGEPLVTCTLASRPRISEIVDLLDRVGSTEAQLTEWSKTPIGESLAGTQFTVTERSGLLG